MPMTRAETEAVQDAIADLCERAKKCVRGSDHYRATVILRATHLPDGDVVVTDDIPEKILAAFLRKFPGLATEGAG